MRKWLKLKQYSGMFVEVLRKTLFFLCQYKCQNVHPGPPEYETGYATKSTATFAANINLISLYFEIQYKYRLWRLMVNGPGFWSRRAWQLTYSFSIHLPALKGTLRNVRITGNQAETFWIKAQSITATLTCTIWMRIYWPVFRGMEFANDRATDSGKGCFVCVTHHRLSSH
jgi:hypothetical protein